MSKVIVLLHLDVDATGRVQKVEVIGGPPMLRQTATNAVKNWSYRPFEKDGVAVPVSSGFRTLFARHSYRYGEER